MTSLHRVRPDIIEPPNFSDGDVNKRPDKTAEAADGFHFWLTKLGGVLAETREEGAKEMQLSRWPAGYALFAHKRQSGNHIDFYLWGHPSGYRFRSAAEFAPHLLWLATDSTHNPKNCQCVACSKASGTPRSQKRSVDSLNPVTPTRVLRARPSIEKKAKVAAETPTKRTPKKKKTQEKIKDDDEEDEIEDSGEDKTGDKESVDATEGSSLIVAAAGDTMNVDHKIEETVSEITTMENPKEHTANDGEAVSNSV